MTHKVKHITVCICTYKRQRFLKRLFEELTRQETNGLFTYSIVVADNDALESARAVVEDFAATATIPIRYAVEPQQNIALARNKAIENASGDFIAFIDDDELPTRDWLLMLLKACENFQAGGILGPVRPHFEEQPPRWVIKGGFWDRPEHETGRVMHWSEGRTGNLLFRTSMLEGIRQAFDAQFGSGGEDKDFFMRMVDRGNVFVWCNEAVVYETVPPARWKRSYLLKRALLRGKNILKHPKGRLQRLAESATAVPIYLLILPVTPILGHHVSMKICVRLFDHLGRLLTLVGMSPVSQREM